MSKTDIEAMREAIRYLHGCDSTWVEDVPVKEVFNVQTVWEGIVSVFDLTDHPTATRAYAWSHGLDDSAKRRVVAVLHHPPVDSPQKAVQAAIVAEFKETT